MARARWSEHIKSASGTAKAIGFHYMLWLYGPECWTWELVATCRVTEGGEVVTVEHHFEDKWQMDRFVGDASSCCGKHVPVKDAETVDPVDGGEWADEQEIQAIGADGGPLKKLEQPKTWNLTTGGQGNPMLRFTGMLMRSELGYQRFLANWRAFKEQEQRIPLRSDTMTCVKYGGDYNIGTAINQIRTEGSFVKGYPERIDRLTNEGFVWNEHDFRASKFMGALSTWVASQGATWDRRPPSTPGASTPGVVVQYMGESYNLGRSWHQMTTSRCMYIASDAAVLSFVLELGFEFETETFYTNARHLLPEEEQWKLLPSHKRFAVPSGFKVAEPPPPAQLEFGSPERSELIERSILFKWPMDGWHVGKITSINMDADRKMEGVGNVNFFVHYEVDDDTSEHVLQLANYGQENEWVLLEKEA